jgi:hypothetical protein
MRKLRFVSTNNTAKSQMQNLRIVRQTSLLEETVLKNDVTKVIHNVVKNSPFTIIIVASQPFDFASAQITAKLLYDTDDVDKEVPYLERRPLEYFSRPKENELVIEFRIHVLSSYHEGSLFKIRIDIFDPQQNRTYTLYSQSIRSVSKPEPLLRRKESLEQEKMRKYLRHILQYLNTLITSRFLSLRFYLCFFHDRLFFAFISFLPKNFFKNVEFIS